MRTRTAASVLFGLALAFDAGGQPLPPAVAACAEETDVLRRLACFDREVAPYLSHARPAVSSSAAPVPAPLPAQAAPSSKEAVVAAAAPTIAAPPPAPPNPAPAPVAPVESTRHLQARITSVENYPDGVVVHLDNGQVWREVEDTPIDLRLRAGDTVTIERLMGAYWISGHNGTAAKVRLKN